MLSCCWAILACSRASMGDIGVLEPSLSGPSEECLCVVIGVWFLPNDPLWPNHILHRGHGENIASNRPNWAGRLISGRAAPRERLRSVRRTTPIFKHQPAA